MPSVLDSLNALADSALDLKTTLESWPAAQTNGAGYQCAAEKLVRRCLDYPALVSQKAREAFRRAPLEHNPAQVRLNTKLAFVFAEQAIRQAQAVAGALAEVGIELPEADRLAEALRQIETQEDALFRHWELPSLEAAREALASHARGETLEAAAAFAEIAGVSREQWLEKVEAHKLSRGQ